MAAVVANIVLILYVVVAVWEDDSDQTETKKNKWGVIGNMRNMRNIELAGMWNTAVGLYIEGWTDVGGIFI